MVERLVSWRVGGLNGWCWSGGGLGAAVAAPCLTNQGALSGAAAWATRSAPALARPHRVAGLYVVERLKGELLAGAVAEHQRLAAAKARRRAIHKAAAAGGGRSPAAPAGGGGGGQGGGDGEARAGRVRFDLPPEAAQPSGAGSSGIAGAGAIGGSSGGGSGWGGPEARVPLTDAEALQQLDRHRLWHSSQAFARGVLSDLRWAWSAGRMWCGGSRREEEAVLSEERPSCS